MRNKKEETYQNVNQVEKIVKLKIVKLTRSTDFESRQENTSMNKEKGMSRP